MFCVPYSFLSCLPLSSGGRPRTSSCGNSDLGGREAVKQKGVKIPMGYKTDCTTKPVPASRFSTSFFMVFSRSSASSIRLASMKSLYLSGNAAGTKSKNYISPDLSRLQLSLFMRLCTENQRYLVSPSVKSGSGSFRKKDFSRLLMTFRSCHLCAGTER